MGGRSSRFGRDKVLSPFRGSTLLGCVLSVLAPLFDEVLLVGRDRPGLGTWRVVEDIVAGRGPLGGIYTALYACTGDSCFVCAADMPRLNAGFISCMVSMAGRHAIVMPVWSRGMEPLHAVYRKDLLPLVKSVLDSGDGRASSLALHADTLLVPEETIRRYGEPSVMFANINTPDDLVNAV